MWKLVVAACILMIALATAGLIVVGARTPGLLCRDSITAYAREPRPAPPLEDGAVLHVGDRRSAGGYSDPFNGSPIVVGSPAAVRAARAQFPTRERCGRAMGGYRYLIIDAIQP